MDMDKMDKTWGILEETEDICCVCLDFSDDDKMKVIKPKKSENATLVVSNIMRMLDRSLEASSRHCRYFVGDEAPRNEKYTADVNGINQEWTGLVKAMLLIYRFYGKYLEE